MKKVIALFLAALLMLSGLSGCGYEPTEEELLAQKLEAMASEEASTGMKRLTSVNLEDCEVVLQQFVEGLQQEDAEKVAASVGSPNVFEEGDLYGWILTNGFEALKNTAMDDIKIKTTKNGATAQLMVYINTSDDEAAIPYVSSYEDGHWLLEPPSGVVTDFTFTAPTKQAFCRDVALSEYATSADVNGYSWTFVVPHMIEVENSSAFTIKSNLGEFAAKMYLIRDTHTLVACLTEEQKGQFEEIATQAFQGVFDMLKNGAQTAEVANLLLAENTLLACFPSGEERIAEYNKELETVTSVTMMQDDAQNGYPAEYTYRLSGEDGITMDVKLRISTTLGDSRKKASITMQNFDGSWKIVSVSCKDNSNPFVDFETYNPAW